MSPDEYNGIAYKPSKQGDSMSNEIHSTKKYDIFKSMKNNRGSVGINPRHFKALLQSVKERNLLHTRPIIVNEDFTIIDGHHRLEVAKALGLPIYYTFLKEGGYEDAMRLTRGTTDWSTMGYIQCRASNGEQEFVKLKTFLDENGISPHALFRMMNKQGSGRQYSSRIKKGDFEFTEEIESMKIYFDCGNKIIEMFSLCGIKMYKSRSEFFAAVKVVFSHPLCDADKMLKKLEENVDSISRNFTSWKSLALSFIKIYNHNLAESKKLPADDILEGRRGLGRVHKQEF